MRIEGKPEWQTYSTSHLLRIPQPYIAARPNIEKEKFKFLFIKIAFMIKYLVTK